jgi:hypothetical protein
MARLAEGVGLVEAVGGTAAICLDRVVGSLKDPVNKPVLRDIRVTPRQGPTASCSRPARTGRSGLPSFPNCGRSGGDMVVRPSCQNTPGARSRVAYGVIG